MAKYKKEDRTIPELVISDLNDQEFHAPSNILDVDNYTCFGVTGKDKRILSLKVFFSNGGMALISYGRMSSIVTYDAIKKMIAIETPSLRLEISGTNLVPLMDYIGEQRLAWVKSSGIESETDAFMVVKGEPTIKSIRFLPKQANP